MKNLPNAKRFRESAHSIEEIIESILYDMAVDGETKEDMKDYRILNALNAEQRQLLNKLIVVNFNAGVNEGRCREKYQEED
jgi:hypothetical protein